MYTVNTRKDSCGFSQVQRAGVITGSRMQKKLTVARNNVNVHINMDEFFEYLSRMHWEVYYDVNPTPIRTSCRNYVCSWWVTCTLMFLHTLVRQGGFDSWQPHIQVFVTYCGNVVCNIFLIFYFYYYYDTLFPFSFGVVNTVKSHFILLKLSLRVCVLF